MGRKVKIVVHRDAVQALRTSPEAINELRRLAKPIAERMQANIDAKMGDQLTYLDADDGSKDDVKVWTSRRAKMRGRVQIKTNSSRGRIAVARDSTVATRAIAGPHKKGA